jgi:hypothetical protein
MTTVGEASCLTYIVRHAYQTHAYIFSEEPYPGQYLHNSQNLYVDLFSFTENSNFEWKVVTLYTALTPYSLRIWQMALFVK